MKVINNSNNTMTTEEKKLRKLIQKTLLETENMSESDLFVRAGVNWDEVKPKFLETVNDLVSKIDDDKYDNAEDLIGKAVAMLKIWKAKIHKGKEMVDRVANVETLDEFDINGIFGGPDKKYKKNIIDYILYNQGRNTDQREPNKRKMYCGYDLERIPFEDVKKIKDNMEHPKGRNW